MLLLYLSADISRREERVVAQILTVLYLTEPGENWIEGTFRWELDALPVPGWELTESWLVASEMPEMGFLFCHYYSGEGAKLQGCSADVALRKALLYMVRAGAGRGFL